MSKNEKACCSPRRKGSSHTSTHDTGPQTAKPLGPKDGMIQLEAGKYRLGFEGHEAWELDGEGPVREVTLVSYHLDLTAVGNAQFADL